ncbi:hypothetical protein QFC21_003722 [Naganishia friedmannii]|uniref:Uncharacterized protein n=1 Tax=Naganishia friedmannii TaxID=89922 RepID=A0ACC2VP30_9TREE|nr:hypothetical protein QFC21_003722 [Naganishia friedmannii]
MSKENSSSSGTLFARPTKEWVVPQRAKPGRKSTKQNAKAEAIVGNTTIVVKGSDNDNVSTTQWLYDMLLSVQLVLQSTTAGNRDAQRAFRERKTEYVASLEARIESYEKGENTRNVALQLSARATKEENTRLKAGLDNKAQELAAKDDRCRRLEKVVVELRRRLNAAIEVARKVKSQQPSQSRTSFSTGRRGSDAFSTSTAVSSTAMQMDMPISPPDYDRDATSDTFQTMHSHPPSRAYQPPGVTYNIDHNAEYKPTTMTQPLYPRTKSRETVMQRQDFGIEPRMDETSPLLPGCGSRGNPANNGKAPQSSGFVPCGFCSGMESICVCRSIEENDKTLQDTSFSYVTRHIAQPYQLPQLQSGIDSIVNAALHQEAVTQSILDNLPAPEAAVPLRRKRQRANSDTDTSRLPIFAVQLLKGSRLSAASSNPALTGATSGIYTSSSSGFESGVIAMMQDKDKGLYIPPAECSGDPQNCPACKDDDFGKPLYTISIIGIEPNRLALGREFCETLSTAVCNTGDPDHRCDNCADKPLPVSSLMRSNILTTTLASMSNARGNASDAGSVPPPRNDVASASDGMEYVDIPCCGNKELCGAVAEEDCKTTIAIPIISLNDHDPDRASVPITDPGAHGLSDKVNGLAGGQQGSWLESERWIGKETVGADQAWRTLKAHPNAKFCPLSMLAEVVARGTRCTFSPSRLDSPAPSTSSADHGVDDKSRLSLVSLQELEGSGKRRRFEIHPDAVQRALDMLDAHPAHSNKKRRVSNLRKDA